MTRKSVCGDKRGVEVALTDKARRMLREASGALAETVTGALAHVMGPEQCAAMSGLIPKAATATATSPEPTPESDPEPTPEPMPEPELESQPQAQSQSQSAPQHSTVSD